MISSVLGMINLIEQHQVLPLEWSNFWPRTLKKSEGFIKSLNDYRGVFIVNIISMIFEKALKYHLTPHLQQNMTKFQTRRCQGKGCYK